MKKFVKASSALSLEKKKFSQATKEMEERRKQLRFQLKNLLPDKGCFNAAGDVTVTVLERSSYKGISEAMVRSTTMEHFGGADLTNKVLDGIAVKRKGPTAKHLVVSTTKKSTTTTPEGVRELLREFGAVEQQLKRYKTEFGESVSKLKSTISSFELPVATFLEGGSDTRNISIDLENGMVEKCKLKRQSTRLAITKTTLQQALQKATGDTVHDFADSVMNHLDTYRKTSVRLTHPRIDRILS